MNADDIVQEYLGRLDAAAWPLAPERRADLAAEVREHIETAMTEAGRRDEVTVRNVLERLGNPVEIVAAEVGEGGGTGSQGRAAALGPAARSSAWGAVELIALLLLTVGAVLLPFIGPLLALVFVWASSQWTRPEKRNASIIVVGLLMLPVIIVILGRATS